MGLEEGKDVEGVTCDSEIQCFSSILRSMWYKSTVKSRFWQKVIEVYSAVHR